MSEAHWVGNPPEYKGGPWCVPCDKEASEILECECCGKDCCERCSIVGNMGTTCIECIENGDDE